MQPKRIKILLFTENLGSGGAERQLVGLATALKKNDYDVSVMTYIESQFYEPLLHRHNVNYILCKSEGNKLLRMYHVAKAIKALKPDTIISFLSSPNQMMCLLKPLGFRLIVSERNNTKVWRTREKIRFSLYRLADVVVANSKYECDNIKKHVPNISNKTIAITNFVDTDTFIPQQNRENNVPTILCIGRITEQKNVIRFLHTIKALKDQGKLFFVKWYGNHYDKEYCTAAYKTLIELQLQDYFQFYQPSSEIIKEYQSADIFCLPSLREGYPNVVCEAMSCELPIACSNVCENPSIVTNKENGYLFDPTDTMQITEVLSILISMTPAERHEIGRRNRQKMISNNSIEAYCNKYIEIL